MLQIESDPGDGRLSVDAGVSLLASRGSCSKKSSTLWGVLTS